jgi:small ligand-binding sensory domain FIST
MIRLLPSRVQIVGCTGWGIIGSKRDGDVVEVEEKNSVSVLLLRLPETRISAFSASSRQFNSLNNDADRQALWKHLTRIAEDCGDPVNAILLSQGDQLNLSQFNGTFMTGIKVGGFISSPYRKKKSLFTQQGLEEKANAILSFSGKTQFHVRVLSDKNVEATLSSFAQGPRYLAGFMFSCVGRGSGYHGKVGVEADVFKRLFPKVPLTGFFTSGELGPQSDSTNLAAYSYTSIFCMISSD